MMYRLLILLALTYLTNADIVAYDCQDRETELTRVSLLRVKPCVDPRNATATTTRRIQLIQERRFVEVHVYTCLIAVQQLIQHCGMHSHTSAVASGLGRYVHYVRTEACLNAHRFRRLDLRALGVGIASSLALNGTTEISATLEGYLDNTGKCQGVKYTVNDMHYEDVIVSAAVTIKLHDYVALANVEENKINLRSGTVCQYSSSYCFDDLAGEVTWESRSASRCAATGIDVLFEGTATVLKMDPGEQSSEQRYVIVEVGETVFALQLVTQAILCQQQAWRTEQNRLLVIFDTSLGFYYQRSRKIAQNTDLMAQVLSKLLFLEIAVKRQMGEVIYDSIMKRCRLREKILQNRLALALQSPDVVSSLVKESPGHVGRVVGEVLYIARCSAKLVDYRRTESCYQELPILYQNKTKFMTPITHIIQDHGTEVDCNAKLPAVFHLEGSWLELTPEIHRAAPAPLELDANEETEVLPMSKIAPISSHGVYTRDEMESFQRALLFPSEKEAVTNLLTRRVVGSSSDPQGFHVPKLFSEHEFTQFARTSAEEVWGFLSRMGNYFSVFALLYTVVGVANYIGGVVLNYFSLKKVAPNQGRPRFVLLASLWHALANRYLHHMGQRRETDPLSAVELSQLPREKMYPELSAPTPSNEQSVQAFPPAPPTQGQCAIDILRQPVG